MFLACSVIDILQDYTWGHTAGSMHLGWDTDQKCNHPYHISAMFYQGSSIALGSLTQCFLRKRLSGITCPSEAAAIVRSEMLLKTCSNGLPRSSSMIENACSNMFGLLPVCHQPEPRGNQWIQNLATQPKGNQWFPEFTICAERQGGCTETTHAWESLTWKFSLTKSICLISEGCGLLRPVWCENKKETERYQNINHDARTDVRTKPNWLSHLLQ